MTRLLPALILLVGAALGLGASCRPEPTGVASSADDALCAHLAQLGCPTGRDPSCPAALARLRTLGPVPDVCANRSTSRAAVAACGLECPP